MLTNGTRPSSCKMSNNQMLKSSERQKLSTSIRALQSPVAASLADGFLCDKNHERSRILIQTKRQKSKILVRLCYSNIAMSQSTGWKATKASKNKVRNVAVKKAKSCPTSLKIYQSKKKKGFFFMATDLILHLSSFLECLHFQSLFFLQSWPSCTVCPNKQIQKKATAGGEGRGHESSPQFVS